MRKDALILLVPAGILLWVVLAAIKAPSTTSSQNSGHRDATAEIEYDPSRHLIRPFHVQGQQIALGLDGGDLPVPSGQVPSIVVGNNILRTLHLCWPHDWTNPGFRTSFKNLLDLYASEDGASLPALRIYLNPVFSDAHGEELHRAMLQVFFRSEFQDGYLTLATELGGGSLAPDAAAVRQRVEEIDPILIDDWDARLDWLESDIEKTFSSARVQLARNVDIVGQAKAALLTSMHGTLPASSDKQEIITFLNQANASQVGWLRSLPTPAP